jgi:hypothetical protein
MKTVILSTDDNVDYISCLPYVQKAWNNLGWKTLTFYLGDKQIDSNENNKIIKINSIEGVRNATVVQTSRLFGSKHCDGLIMTSDVDMMPLFDYWKPYENTITCYGSDLTNYQYHPICYIAAKKEIWDELIYEKSIEDLINKYPSAKTNDFNKWWFTDQEIITERIEKYQNRIIIPRGFDRGYALGRIDRNDWETTKNSKEKKIDAHLLRPFNKEQSAELLFKYHRNLINE